LRHRAVHALLPQEHPDLVSHRRPGLLGPRVPVHAPLHARVPREASRETRPRPRDHARRLPALSPHPRHHPQLRRRHPHHAEETRGAELAVQAPAPPAPRRHQLRPRLPRRAGRRHDRRHPRLPRRPHHDARLHHQPRAAHHRPRAAPRHPSRIHHLGRDRARAGARTIQGMDRASVARERRADRIAARTIDAFMTKESESDERYRAFVANSSEAIWRFELEEPVSTRLTPDEQVDLCYRYGYLAECNEAMARMYGFSSPEEIIGLRLGDMLVRENPENLAYLCAFIESGYRLVGAESREVDRDGNAKHFLNNLIGVIENDHIIRAWG